MSHRKINALYFKLNTVNVYFNGYILPDIMHIFLKVMFIMFGENKLYFTLPKWKVIFEVSHDLF